MAIPLVTMLGLFADVAYTSVTNFVNLDRAPSLIRATSVPLTNFMTLIQAERRAAVVYASDKTSANASAYQSAIGATTQGIPTLEAALNSPATKSSTDAQETAQVQKFMGQVTGLSTLRQGLQAGKVPPLTAMLGYTNVILGIPKIFEAEASSLTNSQAATQGIGLIASVQTREELDEQDALLAGALASGNLDPEARVAFAQAAGREQQDQATIQGTFNSAELNAFNSTFNKQAPKAVQDQFTKIQQAVESGLPLPALEQTGLNGPLWAGLTSTIAKANYNGGLNAASAVLDADQAIANSARTKVYITGAIGALGLLLTLIVTIWLARSINRRLTTLRRSALALAREHLPSVITRLRRGEQVDVAAEAPPLRFGGDEIGQVGHAFDAVRQTAIASAVEESKLRHGVNDMFRNLARRNQSLLQRQLTTLDQMERKATDPEALDDLFKLDHLTTRMRRHAEGLIILSGAPPGRGWSAPVKLIDVMRGAVSEVEDYARVQVATQSRAALSGSAVTDVIHLLAELIENATSLSPPYTQVRVSGEQVTNGFAIEIEDRGLGMTPERLAELNERLANPPDVNPGNTEQLGLFVVAQLARRHGIQVMLRSSPYGGTSAITLIPKRLCVDEGPAALPSGERGGDRRSAGAPSFTPADAGAGGGYHGSTHENRAFAGNGYPDGGDGASYGASYGNGNGNGNGNGYSNGNAGAGYRSGQYASGQFGGDRDSMAGSPPDLDNIPLGGNYGGNYAQGPRVPGDYRRTARPAGPTAPGMPPAGDGPRLPARRGSQPDDVPVVTGIPVSPEVAPPFNVFNPISRTTGPLPAVDGQQDAGYGNMDGTAAGYEDGDAADGEHMGLPRRVRQANLAPQLRNSSAGGSGKAGSPPAANPASLSDMRNTLSAMQRGWQQGRTQSLQRDTEGTSDGA